MLDIVFTTADGLCGELNKNLKGRLENFKILKTETGKPYIEGDPLYFSLSHSKNAGVFAVSDSPVGIDLEVISGKRRTSVLNRLKDAEKNGVNDEKTFLLNWTAKEAYVKMLGGNIFADFKKLEFTGGILFDGGKKADCKIISVRSDGYICSVCVPDA